MKKVLFFLAICLMICSISVASSQAPPAFRYQAVVRDLDNRVVPNRDGIQVRVRIFHDLENQPNNVVYDANYIVRSNELGIINISIGTGDPVQFADIPWGVASHHVQLQINIPNEAGNPTGFANLGTMELLSVPYALFARYAANAGGGGGDSYWEFEEATNRLRNINTGPVIISGGIAPAPFPTTAARLFVGGNIGLPGGFYINSPVARPNSFFLGHPGSVPPADHVNAEIAFNIGHNNRIAASEENVFVLGASNTVTEGENVLAFGERNRIAGASGNDATIVIGINNEIESGALNNILIGDTIVSEVDNVIALGSLLKPSQHSIFIGRDIIDEGFHPTNTNNILMGHNMELTGGLEALSGGGASSAMNNSIFIGNNFRNWNNNTAPGVAFSASQTIGIGNQIHPHRNNNMGEGGHNSISIGNRISTSSQRSINIGEDITAEFATAVGATRQTIAIGRDITFPLQDEHSRAFNNDGAIVLGTNFPGISPNILGRGTAAFPINTPDGVIPGGPRPRFVVGGHATWRNQANNMNPEVPIHFLYIDDFANAYFGFTGMGHMQIIEAPSTLNMTIPGLPTTPPGSNQIAATPTGGVIFARQLVALADVATPSDRNLKTNIVSLRDRNRAAGASRVRAFDAGLDETGFSETLFSQALSNINVYSYNLTLGSTNPREQWGFMAQDVFPYFPHLVTTFDGETLSMTYTEFIPILWSIAQDQQVQIEEQQARIIELEERLRRIEAVLGLD